MIDHRPWSIVHSIVLLLNSTMVYGPWTKLNNMHNGFLTTGALLGGLAVGLGAFGAHGLQQATQDEKIIHSFQTAVQYQMYHALALLAVAIIFQRIQVALTKWAGNCFVIG